MTQQHLSGGPNLSLKVTVCVGESCTGRGSHAVLAQFSQVLNDQQIPHRVSLVGCHCLDRCGCAMNWKFDDQELASSTAEEALQTLRQKVADASAAKGPSDSSTAAPD